MEIDEISLLHIKENGRTLPKARGVSKRPPALFGENHRITDIQIALKNFPELQQKQTAALHIA